ncbi:GntR family transcriptional regulator [uncultured Robinsoniella sp.]|uniref:GntR family transcriptional regulator n=1 Tax=uncultured Robinsoniella sp. TaxID=904190 RepID=UPI00374F72AB
MEIIISNNKSKPIYEQITSQIKAAIMSGEMQPGEMLPSMRALAKSLHISVITAQKAYEDLQRDGFIETVTGRGTFVADTNKDFFQEEKLRNAEEKLQEAAEIGRSSGISLQKLIELLTIFYEEEEDM